MADDPRDLFERMAREVDAAAPLTLQLTALRALHLLGCLQVLLDHPGIRADDPAQQVATDVINIIRAHFVGCPAVQQAIADGDAPRARTAGA